MEPASTPKYSAMMERLQRLVAEIGDPQTDIDTMVAKVEQGYELVHQLHERLEQTKMRVEELRQRFETPHDAPERDGTSSAEMPGG